MPPASPSSTRKLPPSASTRSRSPRSPAEIASYFDGLELVDPGLVDVTRWRLDPPESRPLHNLVGVGRKPV